MDRLPDELLLSVGQYARTGWDGQADLHALILCCRRFQRLFQPLLLSYISMQHFSHRSIPLVMRMWREPSLARQVRRLDLCWSICENGDDEYGDGEDGEAAKEKAVAFAQEALDEIFDPKEEAEKRDEWEEHIDGDSLCAEAWSALLLVRLPRLETIEFAHETSELMADILSKAVRRGRPFHEGAHPFAHLREVLANVAWGGSWIDSSFLTPFFAFPAVRTVTGSIIFEEREDDDHYGNGPDALLTELRPASSPVREISFDKVHWCRGLLGWLAACKALEQVSFTNELQRGDHSLEEALQFNMAQFRNALLPFTATLRTLRVSYGYRYKSDVVDERDEPERPFGSFRDFAVLEDLSVRHDHLVSMADGAARRPLSETLPGSLVSLEITDVVVEHHRELLVDLSHVLREKHELFNKLKRLVLCARRGDAEKIAVPIEDLRRECTAASVSLTVMMDEYN